MDKQWDVFISHASDDKATVAKPLADLLTLAGARVWLDQHELRIGDSLSAKIDEGLANSQFGVVILSPAFFSKHWPKKELAGLRSREEDDLKVILPLWHNLDRADVARLSPILADALAANTRYGLEEVARQILDVVFDSHSGSPSVNRPSTRRQLINLLDREPQVAEVLTFLRLNLSRSRHGTWFTIEPYNFYSSTFDGYDSYVGHGCRLTLYRLVDVWSDPFDSVAGRVTLRRELLDCAAEIALVKQSYQADSSLHANLRQKLLATSSDSRIVEYLTGSVGFDSYVPEVRFNMFGGRRVAIDADQQKHQLWSEFRDSDPDTYVRTYDYLVEIFDE